ncbi:hypothetical protein [Bradyrhizobium pachyrhizi]|uniref:hypothetical protein n=1 Tax=Bradyrhizobium pachyrhizi TaxID=280333 RepID=UPI00067CB949|nr:hypothetical protein [Bradyrhizobium pachyrhizi]
MPQKSGAAFKAGFFACAIAVTGVVGYGGDLVVKQMRPDLEKAAVTTAKTWVKEAFFDEPLFTKPVYVTLYYSDEADGHKYQTWKMTLQGKEHVHGEIEDVDNGNKGVVDGYWRAGTLNISYASAAPDRPGIGSFTLRPMYPGLADKTVTYAGLALVHECECQVTSAVSTGGDQLGVTPNGPMLIVPAVLTNERVLPQNIAASFFVKNPARPDIVWPSDIMKTASANNR